MSAELSRAFMDGAGLSPLSDQALNLLSAISRKRTYRSGQVLFHRGDKSNELFLVVTGWVKLSVVSIEGAELVFRYAGPNSLIGEIGVLGNRTRTADAKAVQDVELLSIEKAALFQTFGKHPDIAEALLACLCDRICATTDQLEGLALTSLESRLARLILQLAKARTESERHVPTTVTIPYSQSEIAELVTGSRQQVNRALKNLEKLGAIQKHDRTRWIVNVSLLADRAG